VASLAGVGRRRPGRWSFLDQRPGFRAQNQARCLRHQPAAGSADDRRVHL